MQRLEKIETRPDSGQISGTQAVDAAQDPAPVPADRLKRALKRVVAAAFRLHDYRSVRTRMLHEALSASLGDTRTGNSRPSSQAANPPASPPESAR